MTLDSFQVADMHRVLNSITPLPLREWEWLQAQLQCKVFGPREDLFYPGSSDAGLHFIGQGLVRYYYSNEKGVERNHGFAAEENLVGCFPVFAGYEACSLTVQALEETTTQYFSGDVIKQFGERDSCWARLQMRLMAHVAMRKAVRERTLLLDSPEQRYRSFLENYSDIATRLPQYHVASYIGITPVALSRIRSRINRG